MAQTCAEAVREAVTKTGRVMSAEEIINHIYRQYPERPWKKSTIRAHLIGCSVNHSSSRHYPSFPKFLFTVGRGRVRLYQPEKNGIWKVDEQGARPIDRQVTEETGREQEIVQEAAIGLERDLENFIVEDLGALEDGLSLYEGGRQYPVSSGRIDILAKDGKGGFVAIELKAGTATDSVLTQILAYMADVGHELADGKGVRGIVVAHDFTDRLVSATSLIPSVRLVRYKATFQFEQATRNDIKASA